MAGLLDLYIVTILQIEEYFPDTRCYRAKPFIQSPDQPARLDYYLQSADAVNCSGPNKDGGAPQVVRTYKPQSAVLACIPREDLQNSVSSRIGYIIGEIATPVLSDSWLNTETETDFDASAITRVPNIINQTHRKSIKELSTRASDANKGYNGNLDATELPGDYSIIGKNTRFRLDNYSATVGTSRSNTYYDYVLGELNEVSLFKNCQTMFTSDDMYIAGNKTLKVSKFAYNTNRAFFDGYETQDINGKAVLKKVKEFKPHYDYIEAHGSQVGGKYQTIYNAVELPENTPAEQLADKLPIAFQSFLGEDGTLNITSMKGIKLSHGLDFVNLKFQEGRVLKDGLSNVSASPIKADITPTEPGKVPEAIELTKLDGTTDFIYKSQASLEISPDGSIKLTDAWGSYILLSQGKVHIRAASNLITLSENSTVVRSGNSFAVAACDLVELSADKGVIVSSLDSIELNSNNYLAIRTPTIQVKSNLSKVESTVVEVISDHVGIGSDKSSITIRGAQILSYGSISNNMITSSTGVSLDTSAITINGTTCLSGYLQLGNYPTTIKVRDQKDIKLPGTAGGCIMVTEGSLYVKQNIMNQGLISTEEVLARSVAAAQSNEGKMYKVENYSTSGVGTILDKRKSQEFNYSYQIGEQLLKQLDELNLPYKNGMEDLTYTISGSLEGATDFTLSPTTSSHYAEKPVYKFPGEHYWSATGLSVINNTTGETIRKGFQTYGFNSVKSGTMVTNIKKG